MPAVANQNSNGAVKRDVEVLITGYGPFLNIRENPSWLAIKNLHESFLDVKTPPSGHTSQDASGTFNRGDSHQRIHIQTIETAVCYSHVLSLIPAVHGVKPHSPFASPYLDPSGEQPKKETNTGPQGNGSTFPEGYTVKVPDSGKFDVVIHIGVGMAGAIAIEKLGHKRGYQSPDVKGEFAPPALDQSSSFRKAGEQPSDAKAEMAERNNFEEAGIPYDEGTNGTQVVRGFGEGYEDFEEEEVNAVDASKLIRWLSEHRGLKNIRESNDAGRFLCDFIYYCSLCESKRAAKIGDARKTVVQFIHVPPKGRPFEVEEAKEAIKAITWWLAVHGE